MPDPLPSDVVVRLKSDPTAALAAALILAGAFPDLVSWAVRVFSSKDGCATPRPGPKAIQSQGETELPSVPNAVKRNRRHNSREAAADHDRALLALMRANPGASATEIIRMNGRPRNSTVLSLERLEKAGLVEHAGRGKWTVVDPDLLISPPAKPAGWIAPLSGGHQARHAADGRVRGELTLAGA